jgi:hypothetical protein
LFFEQVHGCFLSSGGFRMADEDETSFIQLAPPTQCAMWERPELALGKFSQTFELVEEYVDDSHLERSLWKCKECGHLYFREWYEWVDWNEGNDKIYATLIPVRTPDEIAALQQTTIYTLMRYSPRLQLDNRKPVWIGKN